MTSQLLTPLDWITLGVLLVSMLVGFFRGFLMEALSLCGWVGGFFVARAFADQAAALLPLENALPGVRLAAGFALVFAAVVFACSFTAWMVSRAAESVGLRAADRGLGMVFGFARAAVVMVLLVWLGNATSLSKKDWWPHSFSWQLASGFLPLLPQNAPLFPSTRQVSALLEDPYAALDAAAAPVSSVASASPVSPASSALPKSSASPALPASTASSASRDDWFD